MSVGVEPPTAADVEVSLPLPLTLLSVLVSLGVEPLAVAVAVLPLPPLSADPVAMPATLDTTAVVVLLGCGLSASSLQENMTDLPS